VTFNLSKVLWALFNPGNAILLGATLGLVLWYLPWRGARRFGRGLTTLVVLVMLTVAVLPIGVWLVVPLEERFARPAALPERVDGIIALGGAIHLKRSVARDAAELNQHGERMIAFTDLARRYPEARLIFAGGSGSLRDQVHKESDFAPGLVAELGIDPARVIYERESRNTYENALYTRRLAQPGPDEVWLLVTSAFHMPRAVGVFRHAGWQVVPYPVDYQSGGLDHAGPGFDFIGGLELIDLALHEWVGLVAYRSLGWSDELYPAPATD